jgi:hypothetical protein
MHRQFLDGEVGAMQWDEARAVAHALGTPLPATEVPLAVVGPGASGDQPVRLLALPWGAARPTLTIGAADAAADHVWSALP